MILISILIVFISINVVSADENVTDAPTVSDVILNTSDADLLGQDLVYNATLQSVDDTPLNNQAIVFSLNGINYTRITNLEGMASLNINLNDGIYPISTTFTDKNNRQLINNNTIYVSHNYGTLIKDNLSGTEIQKIIDDANSGDTLIFAGDTYTDVSINVNKPLNIISIVKSVFNGNSNSPVINVNSNDVNITNFVIKSGLVGINLQKADNAKITYNNIINNYDGINVLDSKNVSIVYNNISSSKNYGIHLKESVNANISFNTLLSNFDGIYFDNDVVETQIFTNYISKSQNNAVNFAKSGSHTDMSFNMIERNVNGIFIDMVGDEDLNINFNTIQQNSENGVYFGSNYYKSNESGILGIGNNSIVYNKEFNILARDSIYTKINLKENYIAADNPRFNGVCEKIKFKKFHLSVSQIDGNTLSVGVDGVKTDTALRVSYDGGKRWQTVNLNGGQGTIAISNDDGKVIFDYFEENVNYQYQMENYVPPVPVPVNPTTPDDTKNPETNDSPNNSGGTNSNNGEHIDGNGTSSNPNSGSSQPQSGTGVDNSNNPISDVSSQSAESSSSQAASQAVSSASDSQSVSKQVSDPSQSVAKALNIDEEVVRIAGMGFILLLIITVIGLFYADDVKYMLNRRNGH